MRWLLVMVFFGWRAFRNRREVAALAGAGARMRRIGIVAPARRLLIAL